VLGVIIYAVVDDSLSPTSLLGDAVETCIRRADAERFIDDVRADEPELGGHLRIEEREARGGRLDLVPSAARLETLDVRATRRSRRRLRTTDYSPDPPRWPSP
jgi:hypothetical protein